MTDAEETLPGLWHFQATHPGWTEEEGGVDGWEPIVAWWALRAGAGLVLIDPLVADWDRLDALVEEQGGCAGVVRTLHWHERSVAETAERYRAAVWAARPPAGELLQPFDDEIVDGGTLWDGAVQAFSMERADEIALWLPAQAALVFGDAMLRRADGELYVCPDSWLQPEGGPARLRAVLRALTRLPVEHVLVAHGPLVVGDGLRSLQAALD